MSDSLPHFARRMTALRRARKLTIYALAQQTGLSRDYLGRIERGVREPGLRSAARIATVLGVGVQEMIDPEWTRV